jgi:hypothetical protein
VRPERFELPTFWFVAVRPILPNLARGVANRTDSASWATPCNLLSPSLSPIWGRFCRGFPRSALHFGDSWTNQDIVHEMAFLKDPSTGFLQPQLNRRIPNSSSVLSRKLPQDHFLINVRIRLLRVRRGLNNLPFTATFLCSSK